MKKVLSFVLVLALVLGSFSMAFAAAPTDVVGTNWEKAVAALVDLGVVNGYEDGSYKPAQSVTRAEAAKLVITALGLEAYAGQNTATFLDTQNHWAQGFIGYAEALGLIKGDGNGYFRPNDTVSYQEMATILVRAVGYTDEALPGAWPANYVVRAQALGIMKDVNQAGNAAANRGDVAVMIYNNLENQIGYVDKDAAWIGYTVKDGDGNTVNDTMLSRLSRKTAGSAIVLTNNSSIADGVNLTEYYGAYVIPFVTNDNDKEITGLKEIKSTFLTGKFITTSGLQFVVGDDKYDVTSTMDIVELDNGRYSSTRGAITASGVSGRVTIAANVSGKKIKEVYSIGTWSGKDVIWTDSLASQLAKKDTISGESFVMTDNNEIDTTSFTLLGVTSLDKIAKNDAVTIYVNSTINKVTKVEVSNAKVEGVVTKVSSDTQAPYVIGGKAYGTVTAANGDVSDVKLGAEGTFYLNYSGKIANFEGVVELDNYAVVAQMAGEDTIEGAYDASTTYKVKLFTADGTSKIFEIDEDTIVTGAGITDSAAKGGITKGAVQAKVATDAVIAYSLDKNGVINAIEVPEQHNITNGALTAKGFLDGAEVAENAVVFTGTVAGKNLAVGSLSSIEVGKTLTNTKYVLKDGKVTAIVTNDGSSDTIVGVVYDYGTVKNANGDEVYEVDMFVGGDKVTYLSDKKSFTGNGLLSSAGQQLFVITLTNGELTKLEVTTAAVSGASVINIKNSSIQTTTNGAFQEISDSVVVYEAVQKVEGGFKAMAISDLDSISVDDQVWLYETDDSKGHDGYDVIIFIAK